MDFSSVWKLEVSKSPVENTAKSAIKPQWSPTAHIANLRDFNTTPPTFEAYFVRFFMVFSLQEAIF